MIRREPVEGGEQVRVTFAVPDEGSNGGAVAVVGDFDNWDPTATPLSPEGAIGDAQPSGREPLRVPRPGRGRAVVQ